VAAAAGLVGAGELLERTVGGLSGGEQQRVALARAMVIEPRLLLLDEPLANLDQPTREGLQSVLRQIHRRFPTTVVHVTHDLPEATVLADRCAVLGDGRLHQVGTPGDVFARPADEFVARLTGGRNVFCGVARRARDHTVVEIDGPTRLVSTAAMTGRVGVSVRPEELQLSVADVASGADRRSAARAADNRLEGVVTEVLDLGATALVRVAVPVTLTALMTRRQVALQSLTPGVAVRVELAASAVHLFGWQEDEQPGHGPPAGGGTGTDDRCLFGHS
jgi:ABC-type Fe3+/spermidine/putrescine transport system ATPase subunit